MKNIKNIIREASPEAIDTQYYFDDSYINGDCGEESMIYIVPLDTRHYAGFNMDHYNEIKETAEAIQDNFVDIAAGYSDYIDFKDCLKDYGLDYLNESKIEALTAWSENGKEEDAVYGYIVADCEALNDEDYKKLVCDWACIDPEETQLEMISGYQTITKCSYRVA